MNLETTAWFCHGCKMRGNAISFTADLLSVSPIAATTLLKQRYAPGYIDPDARSMKAEVQAIFDRRHQEPDLPAATLDMGVIDRFAVDWDRAHDAYEVGAGVAATDYMFARGYTPETLLEWGFGYDEISDRVVFPVFNQDAELLGFKARAWQPGRVPKYLVLGDRPGWNERYGFPCYSTSTVIFGLDRAIEFNKTADRSRIILCEGELNVVALWQMGILNAVAVNGSNLSMHHARLLRMYADELVIFFDSDEAGLEGIRRVVEEMQQFIPTFVVPTHEGDPASMGPQEVHHCLTNKKSTLTLALEWMRR